MPRKLKSKPKQFPWQRLPPDAPERHKEYVATLMQGLNTSPDIMTLYMGLAVWVVQVGKIEKDENESQIIDPSGEPFKRILH